MTRSVSTFAAVMCSLFSSVALAAPDGPVLEYREPSGVDVEAEWDALSESLADVVDGSKSAFRGEILTTREAVGGTGPMTIVAVVVDEVYRGGLVPGSVVEVAFLQDFQVDDFGSVGNLDIAELVFAGS